MNNATALLNEFHEENAALERIAYVAILHVQTRENYGAHDWDGTGECPQYWKCKGGPVYIIEGFEGYRDQDMQDVAATVVNEYASLVEQSNDHFHEYIMGAIMVPATEAHEQYDEWERPITIKRLYNGNIQYSYTSSADYRGDFDNDIKSVTHTRVETPEGEIVEYERTLKYF